MGRRRRETGSHASPAEHDAPGPAAAPSGDEHRTAAGGPTLTPSGQHTTRRATTNLAREGTRSAHSVAQLQLRLRHPHRSLTRRDRITRLERFYRRVQHAQERAVCIRVMPPGQRRLRPQPSDRRDERSLRYRPLTLPPIRNRLPDGYVDNSGRCGRQPILIHLRLPLS